ncbi:hypothetical protein ACS0TY_030272 [Phlomoides rotata]
MVIGDGLLTPAISVFLLFLASGYQCLRITTNVDRRYKQNYHKMQIFVSSFDVIAGSGAVKPYTALALQTISHLFRCLRDAIDEQIKATRKNLGEEDASSNNKGVGISRLRYPKILRRSCLQGRLG